MSTRWRFSLSTRAWQRLDRLQALGPAAVADVVKVEQFLDLGEAEADPLAAQDPGQPGAVAVGIEPLRAAPLGRDQRLILVEAERAGGDAEFVAQLADRIMRLCAEAWRVRYFTFP